MSEYTLASLRDMHRHEIKRIRQQAQKGSRVYDLGFALDVTNSGARLRSQYRTSQDAATASHAITIAL